MELIPGKSSIFSFPALNSKSKSFWSQSSTNISARLAQNFKSAAVSGAFSWILILASQSLALTFPGSSQLQSSSSIARISFLSCSLIPSGKFGFTTVLSATFVESASAAPGISIVFAVISAVVSFPNKLSQLRKSIPRPKPKAELPIPRTKALVQLALGALVLPFGLAAAFSSR